MPADFGRDRLDRGPKALDLGGQTAERVGLPTARAVLVDESPQRRIAIEGRATDAGLRCDGDERDRLVRADELRTGPLDALH